MKNDDNCCAATSGLGIENYGGLTEGYAALHKLPERVLNGLTEVEQSWVDGYRQGLKEGYELAKCKKKGSGKK